MSILKHVSRNRHIIPTARHRYMDMLYLYLMRNTNEMDKTS